ncbi:MAG: hypothetical protein EBR82_54245 [Caulobacteraceae bacterium]|nr:hypothetical protein [Caulobacteraceae bacterium]
MYLLAGTLGRTVEELRSTMSVAEYRGWLALHRFVCPLDLGGWRQTGRIVAATLAPHTRGRVPKEEDFMPIERPPMTGAEIAAELAKITRG